MMDPGNIGFVPGLLLGFASSLHCAGMCGGIAASLMFSLRPAGGRGRAGADLRPLMTAQAARIGAYVIAGALLGLAGAGLYGAFDLSAVHGATRWAAAAALAWIGLGLTGLAPPPSMLDRLTAPLTARLGRLPHHRGGLLAPVMGGLAWGFLPCGMVYGALFYAMMTGSLTGGASVMAGFGLGTLPSVTLAALGFGSLRRAARRPGARIAVGCALIALAFVSAALPAATWSALCAI